MIGLHWISLIPILQQEYPLHIIWVHSVTQPLKMSGTYFSPLLRRGCHLLLLVLRSLPSNLPRKPWKGSSRHGLWLGSGWDLMRTNDINCHWNAVTLQGCPFSRPSKCTLEQEMAGEPPYRVQLNLHQNYVIFFFNADSWVQSPGINMSSQLSRWSWQTIFLVNQYYKVRKK